MDQDAYKAFYEKVGKINGWDFSSVKCRTEGKHWDFYKEVAQACKKSDLVLDIGTGGGESALPLADSALLLVGIDQASGMIETAVRNGAAAGVLNVRYLRMEAGKLDFPDRFFDVVSCRHSDFCANEIARVLREGGIFLTQQISETDKHNLKQAFGRGQAWGTKAGTLRERYMAELNEAGFADIESFEWNVTEFYETAEDLIFLLKHTPIIPDFGQTEGDFQILDSFIREYRTDRGIRTSSDRFIIRVRR
ncbi:class I SAM-dependent methyltransferase [Paenibacillus hodogayensis]|uniref:Class I SAM-dependent methyltransferase n=1 Tax=Paenibacillus hodogayensis TaxID=279208 RepID=A0ABV5VQY2_9BACL